VVNAKILTPRRIKMQQSFLRNLIAGWNAYHAQARRYAR
jgi:hypothetical protein